MHRSLRLFPLRSIGLVLLGCALGWAQQSPPDNHHPNEPTAGSSGTPTNHPIQPESAQPPADHSSPSKPGSAQTTNTKLPVHKEEIVVTGTYEPVAVSDADRDVERLEVRNERALYPSLVEILRLDPEVDLEERGPNGVQTDVSIRGASFGQTLVLVDGLRMNDAQSGHHNLDLPMPFQSIERIEVLHGSGSTMYGADAMGGVVNFITAPPIATRGARRLGVWKFRGEPAVWHRVGGDETVDGAGLFRPRFFDRVHSRPRLPRLDRQLRDARGNQPGRDDACCWPAATSLSGPNQFYGPYPSWERTKTWFAGASQELGANTLAQFGYRRHTDLFELFRDDPAVYTNDHITDSWQAAIRRHNALGKKLNVFYGVGGLSRHHRQQ